MSDWIPSRATICIVNYRTLELTRLCLRSIRRFTRYPHDVVVVDNDSADASLDYLRSLSWIRLIERRPAQPDPGGSYAHGRALDLVLAACRTEYFVSLHSDTVLLREGWLSDLIRPFENDPSMACVGGGKIECKPRWRRWLKRATDVKAWWRACFGTANPDYYRTWNRTNCSVYRTGILRHEGLSFQNVPPDRPPWRLTVGQNLYFQLKARGYSTVELPDSVMTRFIAHLAHGTQAVNAAMFPLGSQATKKCNRQIARILRRPDVQDLLHDDSLDR